MDYQVSKQWLVIQTQLIIWLVMGPEDEIIIPDLLLRGVQFMTGSLSTPLQFCSLIVSMLRVPAMIKFCLGFWLPENIEVWSSCVSVLPLNFSKYITLRLLLQNPSIIHWILVTLCPHWLFLAAWAILGPALTQLVLKLNNSREGGMSERGNGLKK